MRGNVPLNDVVDTAKSAHNQMRAENSAKYRANMDALGLDTKPISFDPVQTAIDDVQKVAVYKGTVKNEPGAKALQQIQDKLDEFKGLPSPNAADLDALKQAVSTIHESQPFGSPARAVTGPVFTATKEAILKQTPDYAKAMGEYGKEAKGSKELQQAFSLNGKASDDTILRKLQSVFRNNVNTNYGARAKAFDTSLASRSPDLVPAIAGQSMSSWEPRGLARMAAPSAILSGSYMMSPLAMAALPFTSPRLVGEGAYAAGSAAGQVERALAAAGISLPAAAGMTRPLNALALPSRAEDAKKRPRNALAR